MPKEFRSIKEVFNKERAFENLRRVEKEFTVIEKFEEIFPDLTKFVTAVKVERNTLYLRVENSVMRSELNFKKQILIKKVNTFFEENLVNKVKFIS